MDLVDLQDNFKPIGCKWSIKLNSKVMLNALMKKSITKAFMQL